MVRDRASNSTLDEIPSRDVEIRPIRVILADSQAIYRVGIRKILAVEDDIRFVAQADNLTQAVLVASRYPADVMLFDVRLSNDPGEAVSEIIRVAPSLKLVVVTTAKSEVETVDFLRRGVRGIVNRNISADLLVRCVRKIHLGETWLDCEEVNWVVRAYSTQAARLTAGASPFRLSQKELIAISGVARGLKNKEIAEEIGTTEQVVKNYLRKIFDKLGVADRVELALYCVQHRVLDLARDNTHSKAEGTAENGVVKTRILIA